MRGISMTRRRRWMRRLGVVGVALSLASAMLFWLSLPYLLTYFTRYGGVIAQSGTVGITGKSIHPYGFHAGRTTPEVVWTPSWNSLFIVIPLWMPFSAGLALAFSARYIARGRSGLRCLHCDYDLTGNESGVCPECGTTIERP